MTKLLQDLGEFAQSTAAAALSDDVFHHAKRALIDWYAALLPGAVIAPAMNLEIAVAGELDHGPSRLALGRRAPPRVAALINGTAAHAVEFDDIFKDAIYHPGAPTIAAALACAQANGASGDGLLRAIVAGYEISTRIGAAMGRAHYKYWHNTGTIGGFGAASAAGVLNGLSASQHSHALATVTTFAAALQQAFRMDSHSKPLHAGRAAEAGVLAALAAKAGVIGSLDVIDGDAGFGVAMSDGPDWSKAFSTLGHDYNITRMTFKNHGCCGHTFAAIDGALALSAQLQAGSDMIDRVSIATYKAALDVADIRAPRTAAEAKFSLRYVVAHALVHGSVRLDAFAPDRISDPRVRALMSRINVTLDPELDAAFPRQRAARVGFTLRDGRTAGLLQPTRKGDPDAPLSDAELEAKFIELASPVIGIDAARELVGSLWNVDRAPSLDFTFGVRRRA